MMRHVFTAAALMLVLGSTARAEIIDRVLAVVNGEIITLSDAQIALKFALVPADVSTDPIAAALQRLTDRRLMLADVERYQPPDPPPDDVDARLAQIKARFPDTASFEAALRQWGLTVDQLRRHIVETLRIDDHVGQRLSSSSQPSDDDLLRFYREQAADFTIDGVLRPLDEVREQVRARMLDARRDAFIRDWVEGLRRRASIVVLYLPGR
jgi:peptidyl-prolyl cis-trans isomerase SurA